MKATKIFGKISGGVIALVTASMLTFTTAPVSADIPQTTSGSFSGMYKVAASSDPIFPMDNNQEWFLDFGKGIASGKLSGSVAVSLRQNPHVKVRIMAWQYFPKEGVIVIGNPYAEGSRQAVAKGIWQMAATSSGGVAWDRGNYQMVLHRANPRDY